MNWDVLRVLSSVQRAENVRRALQKSARELNEKLTRVPGCITNMEADVKMGVAGAIVRIIVMVDESDIKPKRILWANELSGSAESALHRAEGKINAQLNKIRGRVAGFYVKLIRSALLKRVYATLGTIRNWVISTTV